MTRCRILPCLLLLALFILCRAYAEDAATITYRTPGGITVTAPAGMEEQAHQIGALADEILQPYGREYRALQKNLSNAGLEKRIAKLIGCQDNVKMIHTVLTEFDRAMITPSADYFTHITIVRDTDLKAAGAMTFGLITLGYDEAHDTFTFNLGVHVDFSKDAVASVQEKVPPCALPIVLTEDDNYEVQADVHTRYLKGVSDLLMLACLTPIHEATEMTLMQHVLGNRAKDYSPHPYNRWFTEGTANWVMLQLGTKIAPNTAASLRQKFTPPDDGSREEINLPYWSFCFGFELIPDRPSLRPDSHIYPYATELVSRLLDGTPEGTLAKIVQQLKRTELPNPQEVTRTISDVTGRDAESMLAEYVPITVRIRLTDGTQQTLESAQAAALAGDYESTVQYLAFATPITPGDAALHFNLAWALRKTGADRKESEFELKQAILLSRYAERRTGHAAEIIPFDPDDVDTLYLRGRWEQVLDHPEPAKALYQRVLEEAPQHADTLAALEQMK